MGYIFGADQDLAQQVRVQEILHFGITEGLSSTEITTSLIQKGLSYRRIDMLEDIRRSAGLEYAKSYEARKHFNTWFDTKFEPFRKSQGLTGAQAGRVIKAYQEGEIIPPELEDYVDEWEEIEEENPSPWKKE